MKTYLVFNNLPAPSDHYNVIVTLNPDDSSSVTYSDLIMTKWGEFEFGSDDKTNEFLIRASKTEMEFKVTDDGDISFMDIITLLFSATSGKIEVTNSSSAVIWRGIYDPTTVKPNIKKKTISLKCKDGFSQNETLTDSVINSIIDTLGRPTTAARTDRVISFTRLIAKLSHELYGVTPFLSEYTRFRYELEDDSEYDSGAGQREDGLRHLGSYAGNLLHPSLYDNDPKKIIKACLTALNSYAIMGLQNKLYILPLYYHGAFTGIPTDQNLINISETILLSASIFRQYKVENILYKYLDGKVNLGVEVEWQGLPEDENTNYNKIYFPCIGGVVADPLLPHYSSNDVDENNNSKTLAHIDYDGIPNNVLKVKNNSIQYFTNGGWNGHVGSLFQHALYETYGRTSYIEDDYYYPYYKTGLNRDKYGVTVKIAGIKNGSSFYSPKNVFTVPMFGSQPFRVRKMNIDLVENTTELNLLSY